ncbi:hypothetical protein FT663_02032 [Candidozyma haemuli var. vulneris]|uniref:Uncharacterized protein n=1 Tax=Candidozyma haemuli TaxID=45357 RepID=A0A2V1APT4_9ASCO|nr:hypothetical protein CXQ85_001263 [[Candida] haemuloni]KAF3991836.1 hypothetical protein FT662_01453 [[Candida] haemuloni var. vulneris]KAF3993201.1 hypothetical protein FT663_02032 [[Candida] haemuloni var. vulneris]PVH18971.1 hypothetical protein CXQ85_001263 [[Candida] haemuloni]
MPTVACQFSMEQTIHIARGYACKTAKFDTTQNVPWLTQVEHIDVNAYVAQLEPSEDPMVAIGRAFTRHLWSTGLLDDYNPKEAFKPAVTHTCVLNLSFVAEMKTYELRVAFYFGERDSVKGSTIQVSEKELAEFLFQRIIEGNLAYSPIEGRARYLLNLNSVSCTMNGLDLVVV